MTKHEEYESRAESMLLPMMEEYGYELVDVEFVKEGRDRYLRAYVDKPGGITIDDLEKVNKRWSGMMDEADFIDEAYILEVSSPGLGRQLKKEKDFLRSIGEAVDVKLYEGFLPEGSADASQAKTKKRKKPEKIKEFTGVLRSYENEECLIDIESIGERCFKRAEISRINLHVDF